MTNCYCLTGFLEYKLGPVQTKLLKNICGLSMLLNMGKLFPISNFEFQNTDSILFPVSKKLTTKGNRGQKSRKICGRPKWMVLNKPCLFIFENSYFRPSSC